MRRIYLFFFISGATALLYEIIWVRLLGLVFGNTTHAISAVLTAYMAGLGAGSFWVGRRADRWRQPLKAYGLLEISIGLYAALTLPLLSLIQTLYVGFAQKFDPSLAGLTAVRLALSFIVLFVPTFMMGATLPVLAKLFIRSRARIGSGTALLYGVNTAGAVLGTVLTGFLLLETLGTQSTLMLAVVLNIGIGLLACLYAGESATLQQVPKESPMQETPTNSVRETAPLVRWIPLGLLISGAIAMLYEISWTRMLTLLTGSSTYAFTITLSTFLLGLALGSALYQSVLRKRPARILEWGWLQLTIALFSLLTLSLFDQVGIVMVRLYALTIGSPGWLEVMRFVLCLGFILIPTLCFGALFPVSVSLYARSETTLGRGLGRLYMFNTAGNVAGSVGTGFLLIPIIGIHNTMLIAILIGGLIGLGVVLSNSNRSVRSGAIVGLASVLLISGIWFQREGWESRLLTRGLYYRPSTKISMDSNQILAKSFDMEVPFYREGINSIVNITQMADKTYLKINGKPDASNSADMLTQSLSAHLPHFLHPNPQQTLVIGFGSGVTVSRSLDHVTQRVDSVEIEQAVYDAAGYFDSVNRGDYRDPRVRLVLNDARNHLLIEEQSYDIIVSEPSNPWMAGVASLFSQEFYRLAQQHLNANGILCQWLQGYQFSLDDFEMVLATVGSVFEHVTIWACFPNDFMIIASDAPIVFPFDKAEEKLARNPQLRAELEEFGIRGAAGLLSAFRLGEKDTRQLGREGILNTDDLLKLEFSAPRSMYTESGKKILSAIGRARTELFPPIQTKGKPVEKNPAALVQVGNGHFKNNSASAAKLYYEMALELDPNFVPAQVGLGRCFVSEGKIVKGISVFNKALLNDPSSARAHGYLGITLLQGGEPEKGLAHLNKGLAGLQEETGFMEKTDFLRAKTTALGLLGQWEEAGESFLMLSALSPELLWPKLGYAHTLIQSGQAEQAIPHLEKLMNQYAISVAAHILLADACIQAENLAPAIEAYEALVKTNPYSKPHRAQLYKLYAHQKESAMLTESDS